MHEHFIRSPDRRLVMMDYTNHWMGWDFPLPSLKPQPSAIIYSAKEQCMRPHLDQTKMAPDRREEAHSSTSTDTTVAPDPPPIHPSFIQVAKPYIFEQTIQQCIAAMGVNPLREESLRLQGVTWIDSVRRNLFLYVYPSTIFQYRKSRKLTCHA